MDYDEAIEWIYTTQNFGIKLGLDAPKKLLAHYLAYPTSETKVAHIAGTNGKGSTCAILDSLARSSGERTGLFTSPHLVDFRERVRVSGEMISKADTARHLTALRNLVSSWEYHPTFFELVLVLAMKYFREKECDLIILETGMGGTLDATTAVPANVYGITPIAKDHSQYLGETIEEIAGAKAGIILSSAPTFSSAQQPEAAMVIAREANRHRSKLTVVDQPLEAYHISLRGRYQRENAALALEIAHSLGMSLRYDNVKDGLANIIWPARFETTSTDPLTIIDGAHNPHAAKMLAETWAEVYPEQEPVIIFGAIDTKDLSGVLDHLVEISDTIIFTAIDSPQTIQFSDLDGIQCLEKINLFNKVDITESLTFSKSLNRPILITGSLYLLGEYKALIEKRQHHPTSQ